MKSFFNEVGSLARRTQEYYNSLPSLDKTSRPNGPPTDTKGIYIITNSQDVLNWGKPLSSTIAFGISPSELFCMSIHRSEYHPKPVAMHLKSAEHVRATHVSRYHNATRAYGLNVMFGINRPVMVPTARRDLIQAQHLSTKRSPTFQYVERPMIHRVDPPARPDIYRWFQQIVRIPATRNLPSVAVAVQKRVADQFLLSSCSAPSLRCDVPSEGHERYRRPSRHAINRHSSRSGSIVAVDKTDCPVIRASTSVGVPSYTQSTPNHSGSLIAAPAHNVCR